MLMALMLHCSLKILISAFMSNDLNDVAINASYPFT